MQPSWWLVLGRLVLSPLGWIIERVGNRFYIGAAIILALVISWAILGGLMRGMQNQAYDLIMKNRFLVPPPHPDVVLVDIDEASLAAMAPGYGRWPWPRSVFAEFIEQLASVKPAAIVFDITFVDPDVDHADADSWLREVVQQHPETYFSMVRLNPANDGLSELRLAELPGSRAISADSTANATVAMIVPYFYRALAGYRLGTINLYPGSDGVARRYHLYRDVAGWRIGSLPANVLQGLGRTLPDEADILLNWRGGTGTYPTHSFYPLQKRLTGVPGAVPGELANKIVIVGSTAPSLFDMKPTPMAQNHPGLEILATAVDNLMTGDNLSQLSPWFYIAITCLALGLLATSFVYNADYRLLNPVFTLVQAGFLAISYLCLNYSTVFVDLSAPFAAALIYFFIARTYSLGMNLRRNGHRLFAVTLDPGRQCQVLLLRCTLPTRGRLARQTRSLLMRHAGLTTFGVSAPRIFRASPLLDSLYRDTLLIYWLVPSKRSTEALQDLLRMLQVSIAGLDSRSQSCRFYADAFDFVTDTGGTWRDPGRNALVQALGPLPGAPLTLRSELVVTPGFQRLLDNNPAVSIPGTVPLASMDGHPVTPSEAA